MDYTPFVMKLELPPGFTAPARLTYVDLVATAITRADLHDDVSGINASIRLIQTTRGGGWPTEPVSEDFNLSSDGPAHAALPGAARPRRR